QEPLHGHVAVAGFLGDLLGRLEHPRGGLRQVNLTGARAAYRGERRERPFGCRERITRPAAGALNKPGGKPLLIVEENLEDVLRSELLVTLANRKVLRRLHETAGALGVFLEIHSVVLSGSVLPSVKATRQPFRSPPASPAVSAPIWAVRPRVNGCGCA